MVTADPVPLLWPHAPARVEDRTVILPEGWMQYGRIIGASRNYSAVHVHGKGSRRVGRKSPERIHMEGAQGEIAFHWWLTGAGCVPTLDGFKDVPDFEIGGKWIEVRTRVREGTETWPLELKVQKDDPDEALCVHVIFDQDDLVNRERGVKPGEGLFHIEGWIEAGAAKRDVEPIDPGSYGRPQHFVGKSMLRDPEQLRRLV